MQPGEVSRADQRAPGAASLLAVVAAWLILSPTLFYPMGRDQSVFAYIGGVMARGGMPYRDAWDIKPPGVYLAYAGVVRLSELLHAPFSPALRVIDLLIVAVTALLLVRLAQRAGCLWAGPAAAAWYAVLYLRGGFWGLAQAETWANPLLLGAMLLCWAAADEEGRASDLRLLTAGMLAGGALLLKFTLVLALAPFLFLPLRSGKLRWSRAGWLLLGGALPLLATFLWLKGGGAWEAYVGVQRDFVAPYARLGASGPLKRAARLFGYGLPWLGKMWVPVLLALIGGWRAKEERPAARRLILLSLLGAFLSVCVQDKYFGYHWQPVFPTLALLAGIGSLTLLKNLSSRFSVPTLPHPHRSLTRTPSHPHTPTPTGRRRSRRRHRSLLAWARICGRRALRRRPPLPGGVAGTVRAAVPRRLLLPGGYVGGGVCPGADPARRPHPGLGL